MRLAARAGERLRLEGHRAQVVGQPAPAQLAEARGLLDLVRKVDPSRQPAACYWSAVAHAHGGQVEEAARELAQLLDPAHFGADNPHRLSVLLPAWQMALTLHDGLRQRVGWPQLAQPGRRMEAIHAVERHLAAIPDDQTVVGRDGFATYVMSTPAERPATATRKCGVTWLPWGPFRSGLLIYRHMLPAPTFKRAIQNVPQPGAERAVMGGYYPKGRYLKSRAAFERRGCRR